MLKNNNKGTLKVKKAVDRQSGYKQEDSCNNLHISDHKETKKNNHKVAKPATVRQKKKL